VLRAVRGNCFEDLRGVEVGAAFDGERELRQLCGPKQARVSGRRAIRSGVWLWFSGVLCPFDDEVEDYFTRRGEKRSFMTRPRIVLADNCGLQRFATEASGE
jgi:hypothetical protein